MEEVAYSKNVHDLLKKKPPFLIRYGYIFLILFVVSFCVIGNNIKVPNLVYLSYVKTDDSTCSLVFDDLNSESIEMKNVKYLFIVNENRTIKIERIRKTENKLLVSISHEDYLDLHSNNSFCLIYFISLTKYIYKFLFNI